MLDDDEPAYDLTRRTVEAMYDAGIRLDIEGFLAVIDRDAEVHEPTCLPYGGTYRGLEEVQTLFASVNEYLDLASITVDGIVVEGVHAVATVRIKVRATGTELLALEQHTVTNGKIADLRIYFFDPTLVVT